MDITVNDSMTLDQMNKRYEQEMKNIKRKNHGRK